MNSQGANASHGGRVNPGSENARLPTHEPHAACPECDALFERVPLDGDEAAGCIDCGATVYWGPKGTLASSAALAATGVILFVLGVAKPGLLLELQGHEESVPLLGAVGKLAAADMLGLASVVLATTVLVPALELVGLAQRCLLRSSY
jgi:paraquat-inducible protein A